MKYEKIGNIESEGKHKYSIRFSLKGKRKSVELNSWSTSEARDTFNTCFPEARIDDCRKIDSNLKTFINGVEFLGSSVRRV